MIDDEWAVQEMVSYFPARDIEEPVTKEFMRAALAETELRLGTNPQSAWWRVIPRAEWSRLHSPAIRPSAAPIGAILSPLKSGAIAAASSGRLPLQISSTQITDV